MRRETARKRQMEHKRTEEAAGTEEGRGGGTNNWTLIHLGGCVRGAQSFSDAAAEETR